MSDIKIFENLELGFSVRTLEENGKVLFRASDVAKSLGYANLHSAVLTHCKGVVKRDDATSSGADQEVNYIRVMSV